MPNKNARLAILMTSCDSYKDLWDPFYTCIERFSDPIPEYSFYLNTEHDQFISHPDGIQVETLNQKRQGNISWSRRMLDVLECISEQYVFLVLDDFFVCDTIRWDLFEEMLNKLDAEPEVASIQLYGTRIRNANPEKYSLQNEPQYRIMERKGWKTHFVPTIWRKEVLMRWLRPWESIWAFEGYGSERARRWNYPEKVYIVDNPPIYDYLWIKDCSAVINGKWLGEPELLKFFEKNDIKVDFSKRGKMTHQEYVNITMADVIKKYTLPQIIVKTINRFRSLF